MRKLILLSVLMMFSFLVQGHRHQHPGFIITNELDTIFGKVFYNGDHSSTCIFFDQGIRKEYTATDIKGWGVTGDAFFSSRFIEGEFVEVLVAGTITLFKTDLLMYIFKEPFEAVPLEKEVFVPTESETMGTFKSPNNWEGILRFWLSDCNTTLTEKKIERHERSLTRLIKEYNLCKNDLVIEYKSEKPWFKLEYLASGGLSQSNFLVNPYNLSAPHHFISLMPRSFTNRGVTGGIGVSIMSPRITQKIAISMEFAMRRYNHFSNISADVETMDILYDLSFRHDTYTLGLDLRYTPFNWNIPVNLHLGVSVLRTQEYFDLLTYRVFKDGNIMSDKYHLYEFNSPVLLPYGGISTWVKFGKNKIALGVYYDYKIDLRQHTRNNFYWGNMDYYNVKISLIR